MCPNVPQMYPNVPWYFCSTAVVPFAMGVRGVYLCVQLNADGDVYQYRLTKSEFMLNCE